MAVTEAARVEQALYSVREVRRLRSAALVEVPTATDQDLQTLIETVKAGAVIADYAERAALRRRDEAQVVNYGYAMRTLWGRSDSDRGSATLRNLEAALVTIASFAPQSSDQSASEKPKFVPVPLLEESDGRRTRELVSLGRSLANSLGYRSIEYAARAQRSWAALENINAVAPPTFNFDTFLGAAERLPADVVERIRGGASQGEVPAELGARAEGWVRHQPLEVMPGGHSSSLATMDEAEIDALDAASPSEPGGIFTVWYGTDREPRPMASQGYYNRPDPGGHLHLGRCLVNIPQAHKFGSVGSAWWKRWTRLSVDDRLQVHAVLPAQNEQEFLDSLDHELSGLSPSERTVLVYVHGYATTFNQAAVRAAQIGFDLKVDGPTALFSWPSAGRMISYHRDANAIEASESNLEHFLLAIADSTQATRVNLIAHSMGNRLLARSVQGLARNLAVKGIKLGTIVLAAPDIDVRLFKQLATVYPAVSQNTTMYVSERDAALALSKTAWRADRAGFTPSVTVVTGIHTIEVKDIDVSRLGHGYYAAAAPVLHDVRAVLDGQFDPAKRVRLRERYGGPAPYWYFAR